ncbi:Hypothetical protein AKI40_3223 [Enterobacter sp. FY-07]|nr:Hypothetical protein AKI40_3223 [Enterobacter sp. FY-07]
MCKMAAIVVTSGPFHHLRPGEFAYAGNAMLKLLFPLRFAEQ